MAARRFGIDVLGDDARRADVVRAAADGGVELDCAAAARLPARALSATAALTGPCVLVGVSSEARLALSVLGLDRLLVEDQRVAAPAAVGTAFVARIEGGTVWIDIDRKAGDDGRLSHAQSHRWMSGVAADAVMIDFGKLEHVNSSIVAWLLLLVQAAKPARFELRHVHRQVQAQLTQLRLNHLLTVKEA